MRKVEKKKRNNYDREEYELITKKENKGSNSKRGYFNTREFERIFALSKSDPIKSLSEYEKYIKYYPEDNAAKTYYICNLLAVGKYAKADELIEQLEIESSRNVLYQHDLEKAKHLEYDIKLNKLKSNLFQGRVKEAMEFYYNNSELFSKLGKEVLFYFKKLLGQLDTKKRQPNSYLFRQIVEYREDDFREHIKKHLADFNENDRTVSVSYFNPDFPLDEVIEEIKKYIPSEKKVSYGFIENTYIFKYNNCGRHTNRIVDYFKVITLNNSQDFITMCPSDGCVDNELVIDLNYMKKDEIEKEKECAKTLAKVPTGLDRFYKRYNLK